MRVTVAYNYLFDKKLQTHNSPLDGAIFMEFHKCLKLNILLFI